MGGGRWGECSGVRAARSLIFLKDAEGRNLDVLRAAGAQSRLYDQRRCCVGFCFSQIRAGRNLGRAAWARSRRALARSLPRSLTHSFWSTRLTPGRCTTSPSGVGRGVVILPAGEEDNTFFFVSGKASNTLLGVRSSRGLMSARRGEGKKKK